MKTYIVTLKYIVDALNMQEAAYQLIHQLGEDHLPNHASARIGVVDFSDDRTIMNIDLYEAIEAERRISRPLSKKEVT